MWLCNRQWGTCLLYDTGDTQARDTHRRRLLRRINAEWCYTGLYGTVISSAFVGATSRVMFKARTGEIPRGLFLAHRLFPARRMNEILFLHGFSVARFRRCHRLPLRAAAAATLRPRSRKMQRSPLVLRKEAQGTYFVSLRWHKALRFARNDVLRKEIRAGLGNVSSEFLTCPKTAYRVSISFTSPL